MTIPFNRQEFSLDGKRIVTAGYDRKARIWDAETGKLLFVLSHDYIVYSARLSSDGR